MKLLNCETYRVWQDDDGDDGYAVEYFFHRASVGGAVYSYRVDRLAGSGVVFDGRVMRAIRWNTLAEFCRECRIAASTVLAAVREEYLRVFDKP
jgi:hypothetical protein